MQLIIQCAQRNPNISRMSATSTDMQCVLTVGRILPLLKNISGCHTFLRHGEINRPVNPTVESGHKACRLIIKVHMYICMMLTVLYHIKYIMDSATWHVQRGQ